MLKKKTSHAFKKEVYLLGADDSGVLYWLEAPSWDCGWYWGFGYVENYTNNEHPNKSKDIISHTHISSIFEKNDVIDMNNGLLINPTYTKNEGVKLSGLFTKFYELKVIAERDKPNRQINEIELPELFKEIIKILS